MPSLRRYFVNSYFGVNKYSSNYAVKGELGSWSYMIDFTCHAVKYWLRLVYKSYLDSYKAVMDNPKSNTWCNAIKNVLTKFDLLTVWENQGTKY
jgi:hypothetical protein